MSNSVVELFEQVEPAAVEQANYAAASEANYTDQYDHPHHEHEDGHSHDCTADCMHTEASSFVDQAETYSHTDHGESCGCVAASHAHEHVDKPAVHDHSKQHDHTSEHVHHAGCGHMNPELAVQLVNKPVEADTFLADMLVLRASQTQAVEGEANTAGSKTETESNSGLDQSTNTILATQLETPVPPRLKDSLEDHADHKNTAKVDRSSGAATLEISKPSASMEANKAVTKLKPAYQPGAAQQVTEQVNVDIEPVERNIFAIDLFDVAHVPGSSKEPIVEAVQTQFDSLNDNLVTHAVATELLVDVAEPLADESIQTTDDLEHFDAIADSNIETATARAPQASNTEVISRTANDNQLLENGELLYGESQDSDELMLTSTEAVQIITPLLFDSLRQLVTEVADTDTEITDDASFSKTQNELLNQIIHYLPETERSAYVQALAQSNYAVLLTYLERMLEQSTAGLFQEQLLVMATTTPSIVTTVAAILGKVALLLTPSSLAASA